MFITQITTLTNIGKIYKLCESCIYSRNALVV